MVKALRIFVNLLVFLIVGVLLAACQGAGQTSIAMWLQPDNPALISFPLTVTTQTYTFNANPDAATLLTVQALTPQLPYQAEVRDSRGELVATLNGISLQNTSLTIAPNTGLYEVTVKGEGGQQGILSLLVAHAPTATASQLTAQQAADALAARNFSAAASLQNTALNSLANPGVCQVSSGTSNINIRNGPGLTYTIIGTLPPASRRTASARSDNDWFQVDENGRVGWVSGTVVARSGFCDALPVTAAATFTPTLGSQSQTIGVLSMQIDRDLGGNFTDSVSDRDAVKSDIILLSVSNLASLSPDNFREFDLSLACAGVGSEVVRWGAPERPDLTCGQTITMPFTHDYSQQMIAVALPQNAVSTDVRYTLWVSKR